MPLKLGLPPTRAARAAGAGGAWPDVRAIDSERMAPTAAAAMATVIIEREIRPRIAISFAFVEAIATDRLQHPRNPWRYRLTSGQDLFLVQMPPRPCAVPASTPGRHSFLQCSA